MRQRVPGRQSGASDAPTAETFESALRQHVLDVWFPRSLDLEYGGFLCDFDRAWRPCGPHEKLLEFQARHTWLAAEASQVYPEDEGLRRAVTLGFRYLREVMWDHADGGWFHLLDRAGRPLEAHTKHVHGIAYGIAACVAVHESTGEPAALALAREAFEWLERCAHDAQHGGYLGFLTRDGSVIRHASECPWSAVVDPIGTPIGLKDTNVHSDLLETFTHLHRVWPHSTVAGRLAELVALLDEQIIRASGALDFFFEPDWTVVPDRTRVGYQVQTAFRLLQAGALAGDPPEVASTARRLVDHALAHAWDHHAGGFFETAQGCAPSSLGTERPVRRSKPWWPQTEALKALLSLGELEAEDTRYRRYFRALWDYMRRYLIDVRHGGTYTLSVDTVPRWRSWLGTAPASYTRKGSVWKDSSHDGRALIHCLSIVRRRGRR